MLLEITVLSPFSRNRRSLCHFLGLSDLVNILCRVRNCDRFFDDCTGHMPVEPVKVSRNTKF